MNFLSGFQNGSNFGAGIRNQETQATVAKMLSGNALANPKGALTPISAQTQSIPQKSPKSASNPRVAQMSQARDYAAQRGDLGMTQGLQAQIDAMDDATKAQKVQQASATGKLAFAISQEDPTQQAGMVRFYGPRLGFSPEQVEQVAQNPALLTGIASQSEDFVKMLGKNGENFTLTPGQERFEGDGTQIAAVAPEAKVLSDGGQLVGADGGLLAENAKAPDMPDGMMMGPNGQPQWIPGYIGGKSQIGAAGRATTTINTGDQGDGPAPFASPFGGNKDLAKAFASQDAKAITDEMTKANGASDMLASMDEMEDILDGGYQSGALAPAIGNVNRVATAFGASDGAGAADFERMNSLSRELGAKALALFGGSDTEKELEVAIQTNPGPSYGPEANRAIIARKRKAIDILSSRADFMAQWASQNGSLVTKDPQGRTLTKAWLDHQRDAFGQGEDAPKVDAPVNLEALRSQYTPDQIAAEIARRRAG